MAIPDKQQTIHLRAKFAQFSSISLLKQIDVTHGIEGLRDCTDEVSDILILKIDKIVVTKVYAVCGDG